MSSSLHPLLARQMQRLGLDARAMDPPTPAWTQLLERVSRAYSDADRERYLLEHSQEVASQEMTQLNASLEQGRARLASLLSLSTDWIWEQDADGRFSYVSDHRDAIDGAQLEEVLRGRSMLDDVTPVTPADAAAWRQRFESRESYRNFTFSVTLASGRRLYLRISGEPVFNGGSFAGYRGVGADVTQATLAEQRVLQLANFDSLTGLVNRSMFMTRLDEVLDQARAAGTQLAVLFVDLDRFKMVNDSLGHDAGDELLKETSTRLRNLLREADVVARLGGDEFVVLLQGYVDPAALSKVASRMLVALNEPLRVAGQTVQVGASVGIAVFPADGADATALLKSADIAMYLAKARGKNNFQFFTPQLKVHAAEHFALEADLRDAVARDEFRLHYQPKFDVASGRLTGLEALLRWVHPTRGLLGPADFIALAEESGLIVPIGRWVLAEACRQQRSWRNAGLQPPPVAVNLSARQLTNDCVVDDVEQALAVSSLEPAALELELTESLLMADPERAQRIVQRLDSAGVAFAIDDFGTGYSSLAYLKRFPARTLKLDRSFVKGLPDDSGDLAITRAVVNMAHSLGMQVVAEGVETAAQLQCLARLGCDKAQGYLLGRPMPPAELEQRFLARAVAA